MNKTTLLRTLPAFLAITAAAYGLSAQAQSTVAASTSNGTSTVGQKIDKGVNKTKDVGGRAVDITKDAGHQAVDIGKRAIDITKDAGHMAAEKIPGTQANASAKARAAADAGVKSN